jgi:hypothetical protein
MRISVSIAAFVLGIVFVSASGEPICKPHYSFDYECQDSVCRGYGSTGPTVSILHFNPQMHGYEFPSEYHIGETYFLNGFVSNDNYCKKTTTVEQEYQNYKSDPVNYSSAKYENLKFTFLVQISRLNDTKSTVTYLGNFSGVVKPEDTKMHSFQWVPKEKGQYAIERFIFYDIDNPIPLAPKYVTYVDVSGKKKPALSYMSPIDLFKYGMSVQKSQDAKQLVVAIKSSDGLPVSVKAETKEKLVERGWAKPT